jgi:Xaa-Pro aminopeptidase
MHEYVPFNDEEFASRRRRIRERMDRAGIDLIYATMPESMFYLHGDQGYWYQGTAGTMWAPTSGTAIHVDDDEPIHFERRGDASRFEWYSNARDVRPFPMDSISFQPRPGYAEADLVADRVGFVVNELKAKGWVPGVVGLEYWGYRPPHAVMELFIAAFEAAGARVVDASEILRDVRNIKSEAEIACLEEATRIADAGIRALEATIQPGMTELEVYGELIAAMARAGGEIPAILQAASSGPRRGGHAMATRRVIGMGERLSVDVCGVYQRYHSNVVRPIWLGEPPAELLRAMEVSAGGFDVLCDVARDGVPIAEVNRALRAYYLDAGVALEPDPSRDNFGGWRSWIGGYEMGISFPPDWVGAFYFSVHHETPVGEFRTNMVTNFESMVPPASTIDTIVYGASGSRRLSSLPLEAIVIE